VLIFLVVLPTVQLQRTSYADIL